MYLSTDYGKIVKERTSSALSSPKTSPAVGWAAASGQRRPKGSASRSAALVGRSAGSSSATSAPYFLGLCTVKAEQCSCSVCTPIGYEKLTIL